MGGEAGRAPTSALAGLALDLRAAGRHDRRRRQLEVERAALSGSGALGPDVTALRLDQLARYVEPESGPADAAPVGAVHPVEAPEQPRQLVGRDAEPLVGDRDPDR